MGDQGHYGASLSKGRPFRRSGLPDASHAAPVALGHARVREDVRHARLRHPECASLALDPAEWRPSLLRSCAHTEVVGSRRASQRYFADTTVPGCEGRGEEIFRVYMAKITTELHDVLAAGMAGVDARSKSGDTLAVFGHAVFLNAMSVAVGEAMGIENAKALVGGMDLGETQGIMCDAKAKSIELYGAYGGGATMR